MGSNAQIAPPGYQRRHDRPKLGDRVVWMEVLHHLVAVRDVDARGREIDVYPSLIRELRAHRQGRGFERVGDIDRVGVPHPRRNAENHTAIASTNFHKA